MSSRQELRFNGKLKLRLFSCKHPGQLFSFVVLGAGGVDTDVCENTGEYTHKHTQIKTYLLHLLLNNFGWLPLQIQTLTLTALISCNHTLASHMLRRVFFSFLSLVFVYKKKTPECSVSKKKIIWHKRAQAMSNHFLELVLAEELRFGWLCAFQGDEPCADGNPSARAGAW